MRAKTQLLAGLATLCSAATLLPAATAAGNLRAGENPCAGALARKLRCPNLRIGPPSELYAQASGGKTLLRATGDVRSRGRGPIELHGSRDGRRRMKVRERIYRRGGGHMDFPTRATLHFTDVGAYFGGGYWKVHQLARFELWTVDGRRHNLRRVRTGAKPPTGRFVKYALTNRPVGPCGGPSAPRFSRRSGLWGWSPRRRRCRACR